MASKFIFTTTGTLTPVKFEELGAYYDHPQTNNELTTGFTLNEISESVTLQSSMDNGHVIAFDESGNTITELKYLLNPAPVFDVDDVSSTESFIGYGEEGACKIQKVITSKNNTYESLWASGDQGFDKIWNNRYNYSYL